MSVCGTFGNRCRWPFKDVDEVWESRQVRVCIGWGNETIGVSQTLAGLFRSLMETKQNTLTLSKGSERKRSSEGKYSERALGWTICATEGELQLQSKPTDVLD